MEPIRGRCRPPRREGVLPPRSRPAAESLLPLHPLDFRILLALSAGVRHGYEIIKDVEAHADPPATFHVGNLYRRIRQLRETGLIRPAAATDRVPDDDRDRKFFRLTVLGREVMAAEARRLRDLVSDLRRYDLAPDSSRR